MPSETTRTDDRPRAGGRSVFGPWWVVGGVLALLTGAAPVPKGPAGFRAFGTPVDPDRDCTFAVADGQLTITAPAPYHTLIAAAAKRNAPRVLRDVAGDFTAAVRVRADLPDVPASDLPDVAPGVAAGLVVWADEENYVCLVRLHEVLGNRRVTTNEMHWLVGGEEVGASGPPAALDPAPAFLRVTRAGGRVVGEASPDGKEWKRVAAADFNGPSKVRVGVFLEHTSGQAVTAAFDRYEVKPAGK